MMTNLFSIFDPTASFNLSLNWISIMTAIVFISSSFFYISPLSLLIYMKMMAVIHNEFKLLASPHYQGSVLFFFSIFIFIFLINSMGLWPFIFTPSSHILMTFSLSLTIWTTIIITNLFMKTNMMMSHMVPQGTPMFLSFFMVLIESISNLIRPITLAVRLAANMIAGHLLLSLISNIATLHFKPALISITVQSLLILLESAVALIQAFVFAILSLLYSAE